MTIDFQFPTDFYAHQLPDFYRRFLAITGVPTWTKRLSRLSETIEDPLQQGFRVEAYSLERAMRSVTTHFNRFAKFPSAETAEIYHLYTFIFGAVGVYERLSEHGKKQFRGRMFDGLKSDVGLTPLAFELSTVGALARRGCKIQFHDFETPGGFDFLATVDDLGIEVECKTLSEDIGRPIKKKPALALYQRIKKGALEALPRLKSGIILKVIVPDVLTSESSLQATLSAAIVAAITSGNDTEIDDGSRIEVHHFDMTTSPLDSNSTNHINRLALEELVYSKTGVRNKEVIVFFRPGSSAVILVLTSKKGDRDIHRWLQEPREAATLQFSGSRPAILCIRLDGLSDDQLLNLAEDYAEEGGDPNGLQIGAARILSQDKRPHLLSVVFTGRLTSRFVSVADEVVSQSGPSYVFHNPLHPLRNDAKCNLFGAIPHP